MKHVRISSPRRASTGAAMIALGILISVFIILVAGLFAFEINRAEVARQELRSACEAAALSGAATLASSDNTNVTQSQQTAIDTAITTFRANSVVGVSLQNAEQAFSNPDTPGTNQSSAYIELLDPHNNDQPVPIGDANGKIVRVIGFFGYAPVFAGLTHVGGTTIVAQALGGVPQMDVVLCFDVSGSIDDQTLVTLVKRSWNPAVGKISYTVASTTRGSPAGALAQGTIYNIILPPPTGTQLNAIFPENLDQADSSGSYPVYFSEAGSAVGLRGYNPNTHSYSDNAPPGNKPPGMASAGSAGTFTDLVVNIDGKVPFAGIVSNGYNFPDVATLVEAKRGNLENAAVFAGSGAQGSLSPAITPKAGYQAEYNRLAQLNLHPLGDAQTASQEFLTIMNNNTDAHFGLVGFTTNAATGTYNNYNTDYYWQSNGSGNFPVPNVQLSTTNSNYTTAYNILPTTVALASTNIGDAVNQAVTQLTTHQRTGAKRAIVVFTDGQPTAGGPLDSDPWTNARDAAVKAKNAGIPIYTIGLAQNPQIIPGETQILNDTNSNASTGGIAAIAGNGGKFFLVTKASDLRYTFENIARTLVELVK